MRRVRLPGSGLTVSRLSFGTASLFNAGSSRSRARVLDAACDYGFTHFDTAPYYGFGMAERDLALLLARHRDLTVATKVGLYSPGGEEQSRGAILFRKAIGKVAGAASRPEMSWDMARAKASLEASLRRLGRDHIDLYLLHEPELAAMDHEAWLRWLEDEVRAGRVGQFGLAGDATRICPFIEGSSGLARFVQTADSLSAHEADFLTHAGLPLQITYGYLSSALRGSPGSSMREVLLGALARNRGGSVLVSSLRPGRIRQLAEIAESAQA